MRAIFLFPLLLPALSGCTKPVAQPEPLRPALVYSVVQGAAGQAEVYSGEIHARREAELGFRVGGKVAARMVEVGDAVRPGQVLGRLDPADAQLAAAAARAQVAAAESEAANAAAELARAQKLVEQKFISQAALDARINADKTAHARLAASRAQLDISANLAGYAALTADAAGVATRVDFEAGQVVSAGQPLLRVAYAGAKEAQVRVGEAQARQVRPGMPVQVGLWSAPGKAYAAVVREVSPAADEHRTYLVKATIAQADEAVRLGMTASVVFAGAVGQAPPIALPAGALFQQGQQAAVWVVDAQHKVSAVPVEVVQYRDDGLLVRGNLPAGTQVIAAGAHKLHPGQKIAPMPYDGPAPATSGGRA